MKKQKWITTKEKFPNQNEQCLVIYNDDIYLVTYHSYYSMFTKREEHRWIVHTPSNLHVESSLEYVDFWMKLPNLPQVKRSNYVSIQM